MANLVSKVVYDGQVILDLTQDTVTESTLLKGYTAHNKFGQKITGLLEVYEPVDDQDYRFINVSVANEVLTFGSVQNTQVRVVFGMDDYNSGSGPVIKD